ncbi:MAG TPA: hypothetical protein VGF13_11230, partial [Verrucomicrobiae bacterium]
AKAKEEAVARKESEVRQTQAQVEERELRLAKLSTPTAATNRVAPETKSNEPLIKDPETRALMRKQQLKNLRGQVDKLVNTNLAARLALTDEQTVSLKELVMKKHSNHAEFTVSLMAGEWDEAAQRQAGRQVKEQLLAAEQDIRQFLGPERYELLLKEEKAEEFRIGIKALGDELKKTERDFSAEQREQLLATMMAERGNFPFAATFGDPLKIDFENFHEHFSDENVERYFTEVQAFNERVRQEASAFLTPEQMDAMKEAQQSRVDQAKVTVKLTNALFAKKRTN